MLLVARHLNNICLFQSIRKNPEIHDEIEQGILGFK